MLLQQMNHYNDIDELPELSEFEDDKDEKKLIVFDDFINIDKKKLKKKSLFNFRSKI